MTDPEDFLDIKGIHAPRPKPRGVDHLIGDSKSKWKSVWFQCCHVYSRIYRNAEQTKYEGNCPKCGGRIQALIGPNGTNKGIFRAQ